MIVLPWPDKRLSPNARLHWAAKSKVRSKAREDGRYSAYCAMGTGLREVRAKFAGDTPIPVTITFYPPDARHRDDDNMVGSFKSYRDGIADALGVNDRRFRPVYKFAEPEKPGRVEVSFQSTETSISAESGVDNSGTDCYKERAGNAASTAPGPDQFAKGAR